MCAFTVNLIDFDRNFIGRDALVQKKENQRRTKVTLEWSDEDVASLINDSLFPHGGAPTKYLNMPMPMYATFESDAVMKDGKVVGVSQWPSYTANANHFISLGLVDIENAEPGAEVTLLWGEPDSQRPTVEGHQLREIRAKVARPMVLTMICCS